MTAVNNRTNAFNSCKPTACVGLLKDPLHVLLHRCDPLFQSTEFLVERSEQLSAKSGRQRVVLLDDSPESPPQLAQMNRNHDAVLSQQIADLIAELGAACDHPAAYPVVPEGPVARPISPERSACRVGSRLRRSPRHRWHRSSETSGRALRQCGEIRRTLCPCAVRTRAQ
jgi:hypothetical protein